MDMSDLTSMQPRERACPDLRMSAAAPKAILEEAVAHFKRAGTSSSRASEAHRGSQDLWCACRVLLLAPEAVVVCMGSNGSPA